MIDLRRWLAQVKSALPFVGASKRTANGNSQRAQDIQTDIALLAASELFDADWYLASNPDVAQAGMDPIRHYLHHGAAEGREPGPLFDSAYYLDQLPAARNSGTAPLLHFLRIGKSLGYTPRLQWSEAPWWWSLRSSTTAIEDMPQVLASLAQQPSTCIIIPVYNAVEATRDCLASVLAHTPASCRVMVIDDASPSAEIHPLLSSYQQLGAIEYFRNKQNLGYTRTINKGIALAATADVVLLNSDTQVTPGWLERLRLAAYSDTRIGTATPLSNNAGAFSAPEPGFNSLPEGVGLDRFARIIAQGSKRSYPRVPTGNGFCLYIRRACLDEVGNFDEVAFPRGYGEENDFCMRAGSQGWAHLIDDATYIYHQRSASFGEAKAELLSAGRNVVDQRYPTYTTDVRAAFNAPPLLAARHRVATLARLSAEQPDKIRQRVLYVIATRTGGTPQTNQDLMQALTPAVEAFVLHCDSRRMTLEHFDAGVYTEVASHHLASPIEALPHCSDEYDATVARWLCEWSIELLHLRHIAWHSLGLLRVTRLLGIPRVFSFHDFYTLCPTVKLLDDQQRFCGGVCTAGPGRCPHELWPEESFSALKHGQVKEWQTAFAAALEECDAFITTTRNAREVILGNYPNLDANRFQVIPHGRDFTHMQQLARAPGPDEPLRLVVPGNISPAKGGELIQQLAALAPSHRLEIHILGNVSPLLQLPDHVICHGGYRREQFADKIAAICPHIGAVFSIWPETWCHTLTELWAAGIPVVGLNIGAVGERIAATNGGWLVDEFSASAIWARLQTIHCGTEWAAKQRAVRHWQLGLGKTQTCAHMSQQYSDIYHQVWGQHAIRPGLPH